MSLKNLLLIISSITALLAPANICLAQQSYDSITPRQLEALVVTAQSARQRMAKISLGVENIELSAMAKMPMLFGENDIIKSITLLPGVRAEGDGSGGFEVRGGNSAQNLIMLDGITLYNP
ncbi:MAG: hypothetical protein K2K94_08145, partial [Muribaculaceae bacterium]|nr:hypothetical protein [Muribaculaceae bacterium]